MEENRKVVVLGVVIFLALAGLFALYYFLVLRKGAKAEAAPAAAPAAAAPATEAVPGAAGDLLSLPPVELDKSDDLLRQLAQDLSAHPRLAIWLRRSEIIRSFVAAVDNVANGLSPKPQLEFLSPAGRFKAVSRGGAWTVDPASYDRYNAAADVFVSLDAKASVRLYRSLKPLFQQAYRDLGYPNQDFEATLIQAVMELLSVPVVDGRPAIEKTVTAYVYLDAELEGLSQAQKQFLRMGPESVQVAQTKLREMALDLGVPENRLPKPRLFTPRARR